jgi:hypothetical protein
VAGGSQYFPPLLAECIAVATTQYNSLPATAVKFLESVVNSMICEGVQAAVLLGHMPWALKKEEEEEDM